MACNCSTYDCLDVIQQFDDCQSVITLDLKATETGTIKWMYEFNGRWKGGTVDVVQGENIVLPWVFNEHYVHLINFYNVDGTKQDVCYKLDTSKIAGSFSEPTPSGGASYLTFEVTEEMLSDDGKTITNNAINDRDIILISEGTQAYNASQFTQSGNGFTYTGDAVAYVGQLITLIFG